MEEQITPLWPEPGWRRGGFAPALSDAEVLTMELVSEFLGIETDRGIWAYFRTHWGGHFPRLGSRSQWAKQAKNLWAVKQRLHQRLTHTGWDKDPVHLVDGFPLPVCHFKRARGGERFKGEADYGYCASKTRLIMDLRGIYWWIDTERWSDLIGPPLRLVNARCSEN